MPDLTAKWIDARAGMLHWLLEQNRQNDTGVDMEGVGTVTINGARMEHVRRTLPPEYGTAGDDGYMSRRSGFSRENSVFGPKAPPTSSALPEASTRKTNKWTKLDNIDNAYYAIEHYVFKSVWFEAVLPNYMDLLQLTIDSGGLSFDFSAIEASLTDQAGIDATSAALDAAMLLRDVGFATLGWNGAEVLRAIIARNPDMDVLPASGNRLRQSRHRHHCTHRPRHRRHPAHRRAALLRQASTRARAWPFGTRHAPRQADVARRAKSSAHSMTSMNVSHR